MPLLEDAESALASLDQVRARLKESAAVNGSDYSAAGAGAISSSSSSSSDPTRLSQLVAKQLSPVVKLLENPLLARLLRLHGSLEQLSRHLAAHPSLVADDFDIAADTAQLHVQTGVGELSPSSPAASVSPGNKLSSKPVSRTSNVQSSTALSSSVNETSVPNGYSIERNGNGTVLTDDVTVDAGHVTSHVTAAVLKAARGRQTLTIQLCKDGGSLGFSVAGLTSESRRELGIFVQNIQPDGVAARDGRLKEGDQILAIDGQSLDANISHPQAISILQKAKERVVLVVARAPSAPQKAETRVEAEPAAPGGDQKKPADMVLNTEWAQIEVIDLVNDGSGLGFGIVGGRSTGVVVKTIVAGGVACRDGRLQSGDHILQIGKHSLRGMESIQVAQVLRNAGTQVRLIVARPVEPSNPEFQADSSLITRAPIVLTRLLADPDELEHQLTMLQNGFPEPQFNDDMIEENNSINERLDSQRSLMAPPDCLDPVQFAGLSSADSAITHPVTMPSNAAIITIPPALPPSTDPMTPPESAPLHPSGDSSDVLTYDVRLEKVSGGLGITIAGYVCEREELSGIFIKSVTSGSAADLSGQVAVNDQIIEVDGVSLKGFTNHQAVELLKKTDQVVNLRLARYTSGPNYDQLQLAISRDSAAAAPPCPDLQSVPLSSECVTETPAGESVATPIDDATQFPGNNLSYMEAVGHNTTMSMFDASMDDDYEGALKPDVELALQQKWSRLFSHDCQIIVAQLSKWREGGGLGVSLEGTVDVENGREVRPHHYIRSTLPTGPVACNGRLQAGDELLEVNGQRLLGLNHMEVVNILKDLPRHVRLVCCRHPPTLPPDTASATTADSSSSSPEPAPRPRQPTEFSVDRLVKAKSDGSLAASVAGRLEPGTETRARSRSMEPLSGLAMWSSECQLIVLEKGERGLGFSILDYQDPVSVSDTVIVIRSLVPGGVAQCDGRLIPGDRLLSVNDISLHRASLDQAVQALKGAPIGPVTLGAAKPLPQSTSSAAASSVNTAAPTQEVSVTEDETVSANTTESSPQSTSGSSVSSNHDRRQVGPNVAVLAPPPYSYSDSTTVLTPAAPTSEITKFRQVDGQSLAEPVEVAARSGQTESRTVTSHVTQAPTPGHERLLVSGGPKPVEPPPLPSDDSLETPIHQISPNILRCGGHVPPLPDTLCRRVRIAKGTGELGLNVESVDGAVDGVLVKSVTRHSAVHKQGAICAGDFLISVNNESTRRVSNAQARAILARCNLISTDITIEFVSSGDVAAYREAAEIQIRRHADKIRQLSFQSLPKQLTPSSPYFGGGGSCCDDPGALIRSSTAPNLPSRVLKAGEYDAISLPHSTGAHRRPGDPDRDLSRDLTSEEGSCDEFSLLTDSRCVSRQSSGSAVFSTQTPEMVERGQCGSTTILTVEVSESGGGGDITGSGIACPRLNDVHSLHSLSPGDGRTVVRIPSSGNVSLSAERSADTASPSDSDTTTALELSSHLPPHPSTLSLSITPGEDGLRSDIAGISTTTASTLSQPVIELCSSHSQPHSPSHSTTIDRVPPAQCSDLSSSSSTSVVGACITSVSPPLAGRQRLCDTGEVPGARGVSLRVTSPASTIVTVAPSPTASMVTSQVGMARSSDPALGSTCSKAGGPLWGPERRVSITRSESQSLGISIVGGKVDVPGSENNIGSSGVTGIFVKSILHDSVAGVSGQFKVGDRILEVDGVDLRGATHELAVQTVRAAGQQIEFVLQSLASSSLAAASATPPAPAPATPTSETPDDTETDVNSVSKVVTDDAPPNASSSQPSPAAEPSPSLDSSERQGEGEDGGPTEEDQQQLAPEKPDVVMPALAPTPEPEVIQSGYEKPKMAASMSLESVASIDDVDDERLTAGKAFTAAGFEIDRASAGFVKLSSKERRNDVEEDEYGYTPKKIEKRYGARTGEVLLVDLEKASGALGISLAGHKDRTQMCVLVCGLNPSGNAYKDGRIKVGDEILEVNGQVLYGRCHLNASTIIKGLPGPTFKFILLRRDAGLENLAVKPITQFPIVLQDETPEQKYGKYKGLHKIQVVKGSQGLGIMIFEGKHAEVGRGIFISDVQKGGPAEQAGLTVGDLILCVNTDDLIGADYDTAATTLKRAEGVVSLWVCNPSRAAKETSDTTSDTGAGNTAAADSKEAQKPRIPPKPILSSQHTTSTLSTPALSAPPPTVTARGPVGEGVTGPECVSVTAEPPADPATASIQPGRHTCIELDKHKLGLGLSIVGGSDTLLGSIIIHEVYPDGAAAKDGRLKPGDQLLEVCGENFRHVNHDRALTVLRQTPAKVKMLVYREEGTTKEEELYETIEVEMAKRPGKGLGLSIVGRKHGPGVFISDVVQGGVAEADGRLIQGDQILAVNGHDLKTVSQEQAAAILKLSSGKVSMTVGRLRVRNQQSSAADSKSADNVSLSFVATEDSTSTPARRSVTLKRNGTAGGLGFSVVGGRGSPHGDLPIYVKTVFDDCMIAGCGGSGVGGGMDGPSTVGLRRGDMLISVDGKSLDGLTHQQAVDLLNQATDTVTLVVES